MKLAGIAALCAFVSCLGAQTTQQSESTTTTTTVNLNGTLIDQGCYTKHTHEKQTSSDSNSTTTTETTKTFTDCPADSSTTSFGLVTPEGKVVRFDDASNTKVAEMIKNNKEWSDSMTEHKPVKVRVVAMPNGDVMVIKEIK